MEKSENQKAISQLMEAWNQVEKAARLSGMDEKAAARFTSAQLDKWLYDIKWEVK